MAGILAMTALNAGTAFACDAIMSQPSKQVHHLPGCAAVIQYGAIASAGISKAEDLGGGFVLQTLDDGMTCSDIEVDHVVQDCNSGRVAVFGETRVPSWTLDPEDGPIAPAKSDTLLAEVRRAAPGDKPMSVDTILAEAAKAKIQYRLEVKTDSTLAINGRKFPLGCGCKRFYPELAGAGG